MKEQVWFKMYLSFPASIQVKRLDNIFGKHFTVDVFAHLLALLYGEFNNCININDEFVRAQVAEYCGITEDELLRFLDEASKPGIEWFDRNRLDLGYVWSDGVEKAMHDIEVSRKRASLGGQAKAKKTQEESSAIKQCL